MTFNDDVLNDVLNVLGKITFYYIIVNVRFQLRPFGEDFFN